MIYKFEVNPDEEGNIEPEFVLVTSRLNKQFSGSTSSIVSEDDLYGIFFNHTTSEASRAEGDTRLNLLHARLKSTPYKVITAYHQEEDESQYLAVVAFQLSESPETYESIVVQMNSRLKAQFHALATGNLRDAAFVDGVKKEMEKELEFAEFQMERLANLDKTQKVALIYSTPDRIRIVKALHKGPVQRDALLYFLEKHSESPNLDALLRPFVELGLVRRDWMRGERDPRTGLSRGEGEYVFPTKDVALLLTPPEKIVEKMRKNDRVGPAYLKMVRRFYETYEPFADLVGESRRLAQFLLDPDLYDFLGLLEGNFYPKVKLPSISSGFSNENELLERLVKEGVVASIEADGQEWICLLGKITPVTVFSEHVILRLKQRLAMETTVDNQTALDGPITKDVALRAIEYLESSMQERVEF